MFNLENKVERAARKGATFSAAGLLAAVGMAFLTAAGWMVLSELKSSVFAAAALGAGYTGAAAIAAAIGLRKSDGQSGGYGATQTTSDLSPLQLVVLSFVQGFEQGQWSDRSS